MLVGRQAGVPGPVMCPASEQSVAAAEFARRMPRGAVRRRTPRPGVRPDTDRTAGCPCPTSAPTRRSWRRGRRLSHSGPTAARPPGLRRRRRCGRASTAGGAARGHVARHAENRDGQHQQDERNPPMTHGISIAEKTLRPRRKTIRVRSEDEIFRELRGCSPRGTSWRSRPIEPQENTDAFATWTCDVHEHAMRPAERCRKKPAD